MNIQGRHIEKLAETGKRIDERSEDEYREIVIENNPIEKAEGSAHVKIGRTEVMAGVKLTIGEPYPDKPNGGVLITNAEFSPIASPEFETGPPDENAIELARVVDRGIRESGTIETDKLCITEGEKVWIVNLDIQILNHDGNLLDASSLASVVALHNTKMPAYENEKIVYEKRTKKLPVKFKPVSVTIAKISNRLFVDPSAEEEAAMKARITITAKDNGNICALQKGGTDSFTPDEIKKAFEISTKKSSEIRKLMKV